LTECIISDETTFLLTGEISSALLWFKSKLMRLVTYGKWEPFRRTASAYYKQCTLIDEAMGLWILHYRDANAVIKKEGDDVMKKEDNVEEATNEGSIDTEGDNNERKKATTIAKTIITTFQTIITNRTRRSHFRVCMEAARNLLTHFVHTKRASKR